MSIHDWNMLFSGRRVLFPSAFFFPRANFFGGAHDLSRIVITPTSVRCPMPWCAMLVRVLGTYSSSCVNQAHSPCTRRGILASTTACGGMLPELAFV